MTKVSDLVYDSIETSRLSWPRNLAALAEVAAAGLLAAEVGIVNR